MKRIVLFVLFSALVQPSHAEMMKREPEVPTRWRFVRTFDADGFYERLNDHGKGAQSLRLRTRYLDPDVNAFVGLVTGVHHFNQDLYLGDPDAPDTAGTLWNWGAALGIKRGKHLWELDLMGVIAGAKLGPAFAIVGEHQVAQHWTIYHRTEINSFVGDTVLDADQGLYWTFAGPWQLSMGYRIFASQHSNRNGPRIGIRFLFESPKIPFLFPSLG